MRRLTALIAGSALLLVANQASAQFNIFGRTRAEPRPAPSSGGGCGRDGETFPNFGYATWSNQEPAYLLYPGDELELVLPTYPDGNRVLTVMPDGRVTLPLIYEPIMVGGRTVADVKAEASARLASELRRPIVEISAKSAPMFAYVGGEVNTPSRIDLSGDANALQAILQAGGFKDTANLGCVIIIRKVMGGTLTMRTANLSAAFRHGEQPDLVPLARGDMVIVPRSGLANVGLYVRQALAALPFGFNYTINNSN